MPSIRIVTEGLTLKEVREITAILRQLDGVEEADYLPDLIGKMQYRSAVLASIPAFIVTVKPLLLSAAKGAAVGGGTALGGLTVKAIWDKVATSLEEWKTKRLSGSSNISVTITLYGPDNQPVKTIEGKR